MPLDLAPPRTTVQGVLNYSGPDLERPRYYANDHSRDVLSLDPRTVPIADARKAERAPRLDIEGFQLLAHRTAVADFEDAAARAVYPAEIERLLLELTGADAVNVNPHMILRYVERSAKAEASNNSHPAGFIHIDITDDTARAFAERSKPAGETRPIHRFAHLNVWRALSAPPQDWPLAVCDARSIEPQDLVVAEAIFDHKDQPEWSFDSWLLRYDPRHRWSYFSNMTASEALVFKTNDSDPAAPHCVPHTAFEDPSCPPGGVPRVSVEIRAAAIWCD
jgi:hypothetical protein